MQGIKQRGQARG